jgi:alpha-aminoadipate carrier protein LysW
MAECPTCGAEVKLGDNAETGQILPCPDCRTELEVVSLDPVKLEPAPEVEEDWGE